MPGNITFTSPKAKKVPRSFFIAVHPVAMTLVFAGLYLLFMTWLSPHGVSTKMFGQISDLISYLGTNYGYYAEICSITIIVLHILEAFIAIGLCYKLNLKKGVTSLWFIQTLFFGFVSLQYLLWPQNALINIYGDYSYLQNSN